MDVNDGTLGPSVTFIDGVAVVINKKRAIELRAGVHGTIAVISSARAAAPENNAAIFILGLKLQPKVEGINRSTGKEMSNASSANHHVQSFGVSTANLNGKPIERRG